MPGNPRRQITAKAEERFPLRIVIRTPPGGFGHRYDAMMSWLDEHCGIEGWMIGPAGTHGVRNDAIAVYVAIRLAHLHSSPAGAFPVIRPACTSSGKPTLGPACRSRAIRHRGSDGYALALCFLRTTPTRCWPDDLVTNGRRSQVEIFDSAHTFNGFSSLGGMV